MSIDRPQVTMRVGEETLAKWRSYEVEADLLTPADAFHFTAPNIDASLAGKVKPEDAAQLSVDGVAVMVGNVDDVIYDAGDEGATVDISGRDRGRFLQDCSARPCSLKGQTLETLADQLASSWVSTWFTNQVGAGTLPRAKKFKVDPGETVLECLNRFAALAKVIIWLDEQGRGVIGRPNYTQRPLFSLYRYLPGSPNSWRTNVKRGRVTETSRDSFSHQVCLSAISNSGGGGLFGGGRGGGLFGGTRGKSGSKLKGSALDTTVTTYKPRVFSGNATNVNQARILAEEEVEKAKFGAWKGVYTVPGHYNNDELWRIDTMCTLVDEYAGISGESFYVMRRRFTCDEAGGINTEVELRRAGVYLVG